MIRIYNHPALECYSSLYGLEKFIGVPQVSFAFQTVYDTYSVFVNCVFSTHRHLKLRYYGERNFKTYLYHVANL